CVWSAFMSICTVSELISGAEGSKFRLPVSLPKRQGVEIQATRLLAKASVVCAQPHMPNAEDDLRVTWIDGVGALRHRSRERGGRQAKADGRQQQNDQFLHSHDP